MTDLKKIKKQSEFCKTLMDMLNAEIQDSDVSWGFIEKHSRKQDDIKRIRRELMTLANMLDPWKGDKQ